MISLLLNCGDKEVQISQRNGISVLMSDLGITGDELGDSGLRVTVAWSPTPNPDHWILEDEETGAKLKLYGSLSSALTTVTKRYPIDAYLIVIGKAGGRGSRMQFDVYSHLDIKSRIATVYYSLWGKNGRTIQQESEDRGREIPGEAS